MADSFDIIVIGAGHNGLALAALLAQEGRRVAVLERRDVVGGLGAGEEFHPGYRTAGLLHDTSCLCPDVAEALELGRHGLRYHEEPPPVLLAETDGRGLVLPRDPEVAAGEIARRSERDAARYLEYRAFLGRIEGLVRRAIDSPLPDLAGLGRGGGLLEVLPLAVSMRRLGGREMMELLRIPPMCVADWLGEWFETDLLKAGLTAPAILGTWSGPWSPGTAANLILHECSSGTSVHGGPAALVRALERAARAEGVVIRMNSHVSSIRVSKGAVSGVEIEGGETIDGPLVAASCDPKRVFLGLLRGGLVPCELEHEIEIFRARGTTAKVHLALEGPLELAERPGERFELIRTGERLDDQERAFDPVKYGALPDRPLLDVFVPTVSSPELAPDGHDVVSILAHFVPRDLAGGWSDAARARLGEIVLETLEAHAPGVSRRVVAREVLTPADLEARYGLTGGQVHHGEHALDQRILRPAAGCLRYRTPVGGLFLCGSGSHPGGGMTCRPGALAAAEILADG